MQKSVNIHLHRKMSLAVTDVSLRNTRRVFRIMKLLTTLILGFCLQISANGVSQSVSISVKEAPLSKVISAIRKQTQFSVFGKAELLRAIERVTISAKDEPLEKFLDRLASDLSLGYEIDFSNKNIVLFTKKPSSAFADDFYLSEIAAFPITGKITDSTGAPLPDVSVKIQGTKRGTTTNKDGVFTLNVEVGDVLEISSIGFSPVQLRITSDSNRAYAVIMKKAAGDLDEVVVNAGILSRNKNSFTGAASSFTAADLKAVGNLNVLQSLKTLDPSFIIEPNMQLGSNPNRLPDIELRGKTSISSEAVRDEFTANPNQPLFILNGMESTLQQIIDLDINRVESITILKDAASTAMFGSKAANGVVVVETIRPKGGELRITYNNDTRWEIADLSGYNMMNSHELLEFQSLAGLYSSRGFNYLRDDEKLYNQRLMEAERGVNTYWLTVPLRQSLTMGHSLNLNGGSEAWVYNIGLNYRDLKGIMKGSDRTTWGGSIDLGYRQGSVNITNRLFVNGTESNESPYGSFRDYVTLAPYYRKTDANGNPNYDRYLEVYQPAAVLGETVVRVSNPLYNAVLRQLNNTNQLTLQNQLSMIWDINNNWRLSGAVQIGKDMIKTDLFLPAEHTRFDNAAINQKGSYTNQQRERFGYQSNIMLTYNQVLNGVHSLTGNLRGSAEENKTTFLQNAAIGFPFGVEPNPAFAYSYELNGKPTYRSSTARQVSALASVNYSYDRKYFADLTYRIDGSTVFGSAKRHSPFWSAGIGWQINKEAFLEDVAAIDLLRVRLTTGISGNQQLGNFLSASVYSLENNRNVFGQGYYLNTLGNENLEWQNTQTTNLGLDIALWRNRITATVDLYDKITDPLIVAGNAPPSSGVTQYPLNVGTLRYKGIEANLRTLVINNTQKRINWSIGLTGRMYKSEYKGFGQILKNLNDAAQKLANDIRYEGSVYANDPNIYGPMHISAALTRYFDGYSPDDLWAVRSAGIDPATGAEVFVSREGLKTFTYNPADITVVGNGRPKVEGVISSFLTIKDFQISVNLR
ncbi:MAG TPA: SusC/RagA family TonB-linked outer membrane protein, partial [Parasegetibacter sp.]